MPDSRVARCNRLVYIRETSVWPTVTVLLNPTDLIGRNPAFASADWLGSKTWCGHVVQLATLLLQAL